MQDPIEFRDLNIVLRRERLAQLKDFFFSPWTPNLVEVVWIPTIQKPDI